MNDAAAKILSDSYMSGAPISGQFNGYKIVVDQNVGIFAKRTWIYPQERFWEYEPSWETERWCRYFGFGHEKVEYPVYIIGDSIIMHPVEYERIKTYVRTLNMKPHC